VDAFYHALARGLPVGDALRAAKLESLRRGAPPSQWAAFTAVGDPLVRIPLREPSPLDRWRPVALIVALALALTALCTAYCTLRSSCSTR
jgi:hypothetical protein